MADLKKAAKIGGGGSAIAAFIMLCMSYISPHEGITYHSFWDGGTWTICKGHTKGVHQGMTADDQQCEAWFKEDTEEAIAGLDRVAPRVQWPSPDYKKVFVDQAFNSGAGSLAGTHMLSLLNGGQFLSACHEFENWNKMKVPKGSPKDLLDGVKDGHADCRLKAANCRGLPKRRLEQEADCLKALP